MKKVLLLPFLLLLASCGDGDGRRDTFVLETSTGHTIKVVQPENQVCIDHVVYIVYRYGSHGGHTAKFNAETSKVETCGIPK